MQTIMTSLIPCCLDDRANKAIRPDSGILRVNERSRGGPSFAPGPIKQQTARETAVPFNDCFHFRCVVHLHEDNGHVLRDSVALERAKTFN